MGASSNAPPQRPTPATAPDVVVVDAAAGPVSWIDPRRALGAGIDGVERGGVGRLFTRRNLRLMKAAGLGPLTYRLRTELAIEAWHWSEEGRWSDPGRRQGYWTSSAHPRRPVTIGWGYSLPRRGDTIDQAANQGWSRIDDGDPATFWKSNPYLDPHFTGEARGRPQWAIVAFAAPRPLDGARITWAAPFARSYAVQYWRGADEYDDQGRWVTFPGGDVAAGRGGAENLRLAPAPIPVKFVRILLRESSGSAPRGATDPRDRMGFAIDEVSLGAWDRRGRLADAVRHAPDTTAQTLVYVSSTDPWHRAVDRDANLEQPGFDLVFRSGLARGLPVMIPVGALYDTPANAAAEIRFLKARGYPVRQVEIGEEPDGQYVAAEDYGALYLEFARAVRRANPAVSLGGPSLQSAISDTWLDEGADHSWTRRLIAYLRARGGLDQLGYFSFEHYPYDDLCGPAAAKLVEETRLLPAALQRLRDDGVPPSIPWIVSEYGFSAFGGRAEVEVPGGLMNAEIPAQFLSLGGSAAYLFGYGPNRPFSGGRACAGFGNLMLFEADARGRARWPMPAFWSARMLTRDWLGQGPGTVALYRVLPAGEAPDSPLAAFAARRPGRPWSVLLVNRADHAAPSVRLEVRPAGGGAPRALRPLSVVRYGAAQYAWAARGAEGRPSRDRPPLRTYVSGGVPVIDLPPTSMTVIEASEGDPAP